MLEWQAKTWYDPEIPPHAFDEHTEIHACFNDECCVRHNDNTQVRCATDKGYTGALCGACDRAVDAMRSGKGCVTCWSTAITALGVVALVAVVLAGIVYLVALKSFDVARGVYSVTVQKLGLSFLQMLGVLGSACCG